MVKEEADKGVTGATQPCATANVGAKLRAGPRFGCGVVLTRSVHEAHWYSTVQR